MRMAGFMHASRAWLKPLVRCPKALVGMGAHRWRLSPRRVGLPPACCSWAPQRGSSRACHHHATRGCASGTASHVSRPHEAHSPLRQHRARSSAAQRMAVPCARACMLVHARAQVALSRSGVPHPTPSRGGRGSPWCPSLTAVAHAYALTRRVPRARHQWWLGEEVGCES